MASNRLTPSRRRSSVGIFAISWLLLSLLAGAWAVATPIGASPDEPAHLIKAASVVRGQFIGEGGGVHGQIVTVPEYIAFTQAQTCYAFAANTSAACIPAVPGDPAALVQVSTTAGLYNPTYYALVGWPSLIVHDDSGIYVMRIASGIIVSLFLAFAFTLIARWKRPTLPILGLVVAITPMVLFLNGTVNPNGLEISATLSAFVAVFTIVKYPEENRIAGRSAIVFVSAAVAANMRGLSLLWLAIALLSPLVLLRLNELRKLLAKRPVQLAIVGTALAVGAAAAWLFSSNSLGAAVESSGPVVAGPGVGRSPIVGFALTLLSTFYYAKGMVGIFGWLDTPAPDFVYFTWAVIAGGLILLSFVILRRRPLALIAGLTLAVVVLPPFVQGSYITLGGIIWQGRYLLPVFVCLMVAATSCLSDRISISTVSMNRVLFFILGLWSIAQFQSFATALRRYAVGLDATWPKLLHPHWEPPGGLWLLLGAFAVLLLASVIGVFLFHRRSRETLDGSTDDDHSEVVVNGEQSRTQV